MKALQGLPELAIELDGAALAAAELAAVTQVRVQQRLSLPTLCEVSFADVRGLLAQEGVAPGTRLTVRVGRSEVPLFEGEVTAAELTYGPSRSRGLRLRGYDALHRLRKRQPVRAHVQVTLAELARELTADLGLTVNAADSGPLWRYLIQHRQSDLELIAELASRCGLYLALRGSVLHLVTLEGLGAPLPLHAGENLLEASVDLNADPACREVEAAGWDPSEVEPYRGQSTHARVGRQVPAEAPPSNVGGTGQRMLADEPAPSLDLADAAAQAELDHRAAREVVLRGVAEGDPRLRPAARVSLHGVASAVAGTYVLTEVTHAIDARRGFVSELSTEPPARCPRPAGATALLGTVTQVDARSGRVRAKLPTVGDVESDWMQVASAGAGAGKGLTLIPDVGDQVLVLCAHGDPAQGVVLGGLWGKDGPQDAGVVGGAVKRGTLRTAAGHTLRFDDDKKSIRLEDATGSFLELTPGGVRLRSATPLTIEAPGQPVVISGDTLDFRRK